MVIPVPHQMWYAVSYQLSVWSSAFWHQSPLPANMMQQEVSRRRCGWDDVLPKDILPRWKLWLVDLDPLIAFNVSSCIKPVKFKEVKHAQLHNFANVSESGYGTVTYVQMLNQENDVQVTFLPGKARVTVFKTNYFPTEVDSSYPCNEWIYCSRQSWISCWWFSCLDGQYISVEISYQLGKTLLHIRGQLNFNH